MTSFDITGLPRCTIDFPLEITPEEIGPLSGAVNTLLKSSYLLGATFEIDAIFNSLFDIAEEIAGVEACGLLSCKESDPSSWEIRLSRRIEARPSPDRLPFLAAPGAIATHFGKGVSMDPEWGEWSGPICEAWSSSSLVAFPLRNDRDIRGTIVFGKRDSHPFTPVQVKLLWALSLQAETHLHRAESGKTLSFYSFHDPLTHLYNSQYFHHQLEKEILRCGRSAGSFSLLLLDIDGFTAFNERSRNAAGDIALQEFAGILNGSVREVDTVARLGGDEFGIILLEGITEGAKSLSQRIIQRFERHLLPGDRDSRTERLSVSIGVASFPSDSFDKADLVSKADRALQMAKSKGGGHVLLFHEATDAEGVKNVVSDLPVQKIYEAGRSVVDMDKFLEILLFTGMQGLSAGRGSIIVKDADGDFTLRAAIGFSRHEEHITASGGFRPGPITTWVVDHQLPLVVSRPEDSPFAGPFKKNGYQTESFLSIPLTYHGQTLGALHLTNRKDQRPFTHEDLKVFAPISSEIAAILAQGIGFRENVRTFSLSILTSLSDALELRFPFLSGHSSRVRDLSTRVGERMGLAKADLTALRHAAELHDVGIVGIPGNLLAKKRRLSELETEMVRKHPFLGSKMLEGVPGMDATRRAILEHHEHFDGSGYPYGLRGDDISIPAQILSVAESYDSAVSARPHRSALPPEEALQMVRDGSGTRFDPQVAELFATLPPIPPNQSQTSKVRMDGGVH
ncbi:MAG: diguanylate cyclase [Deltaproteobacteria bacterium]|nr:MAG: diguanylate cyclase [Deltaproteobacteria bacterium]